MKFFKSTEKKQYNAEMLVKDLENYLLESEFQKNSWDSTSNRKYFFKKLINDVFLNFVMFIDNEQLMFEVEFSRYFIGTRYSRGSVNSVIRSYNLTKLFEERLGKPLLTYIIPDDEVRSQLNQFLPSLKELFNDGETDWYDFITMNLKRLEPSILDEIVNDYLKDEHVKKKINYIDELVKKFIKMDCYKDRGFNEVFKELIDKHSDSFWNPNTTSRLNTYDSATYLKYAKLSFPEFFQAKFEKSLTTDVDIKNKFYLYMDIHMLIRTEIVDIDNMLRVDESVGDYEDLRVLIYSAFLTYIEIPTRKDSDILSAKSNYLFK